MFVLQKEDDFGSILTSLKDDGIVVSSSDTVLGLFAQLSEKSKKKLDRIKQRNLKPYIVLLSIDNLDLYIDQVLDASMQHIIATYWPGPLTIIFKAKSTLPFWIKSEQGTIAIRVPDHQGLQNILKQVDGLFTTSANITDQPLPTKFADIDPLLLQQVASVFCDPDKIYDGQASTIIDYATGVMRIIRQGAVKIDSI